MSNRKRRMSQTKFEQTINPNRGDPPTTTCDRCHRDVECELIENPNLAIAWCWQPRGHNALCGLSCAPRRITHRGLDRSFHHDHSCKRCGLSLNDLPSHKRTRTWIESEIRYQEKQTGRATTYCGCVYCGADSRGGVCGECWRYLLGQLSDGETVHDDGADDEGGTTPG